MKKKPVPRPEPTALHVIRERLENTLHLLLSGQARFEGDLYARKQAAGDLVDSYRYACYYERRR